MQYIKINIFSNPVKSIANTHKMCHNSQDVKDSANNN